MKLVDKMKDERLELRFYITSQRDMKNLFQWNFMTLYCLFIYHDAFRKEILKHDTLKDVIEASIEAASTF